MKADLLNLNTSVHNPKLVPIAKKLMFAKWITVYKEIAMAAKFEASWGEHWFACSEAKEGGPGGVLSCNNMLEAKNLVIKQGLEREKPTVMELVPQIAKWIKLQAQTDIGLGLVHNPKVTRLAALL